ncbi:hypothetical protein F0L74_23135 [Chitinophaga agrisoli]|uniref:Uncharacterized protein n=1 Tax=Chitinophaga agrisoli TaxID=2607653 RepID=A0A5B2VKA8_9BACT|nr:hypothetical protein [Chitinophaga agrisoli]KAA2239108.1 hypothetical protein F0L74_23135 [Chitinophaga agrisoli]
MAKQTGILPLEGTIGNVTFYKTKAGYLARQKGGVDGRRIATDPAFQRTRENGSEFGRAGKASKLLRTAFRALLLTASDSYLASRLTAAMVKVIRADATNVRGQRNVIDGEAELLSGFEFNPAGRLGGTLYAPFTPAINRVSGALTVFIPPFIPVNMLAAPAGATHFKIVAAGAEVNFEADQFVYGAAASEQLEINATATAELNLSIEVTPNSTNPLFVVLGIEFYQQVNGSLYSLKNGAYNALAIVMVSGATAIAEGTPPATPPAP